MKKTLITLTLLMIASLNAHAKDNAFIGANYGYETYKQDMQNSQVNKTRKLATYFIIGKYFNNYRVYLNF